MIRTLILTAGVVALGVWLKQSARARAALPMADAPIDGTDRPLDGERSMLDDLRQQRPAALEAGMPADRSSDADIVRPDFADYARGA